MPASKRTSRQSNLHSFLEKAKKMEIVSSPDSQDASEIILIDDQDDYSVPQKKTQMSSVVEKSLIAFESQQAVERLPNFADAATQTPGTIIMTRMDRKSAFKAARNLEQMASCKLSLQQVSSYSSETSLRHSDTSASTISESGLLRIRTTKMGLVLDHYPFRDANGQLPKSEEAAYEVEKVLHVDTVAKGIIYLLKWKNWAYRSSTWEPAAAVIDCDTLLSEYSERSRLMNLIASPMALSEKPYFKIAWQTQSFYICHEWEDLINRIASTFGHAPIYVENWIDNGSEKVIPENFTFIGDNYLSPAVRQAVEEVKSKVPENSNAVCKCQNGVCVPKSCCPRNMGMKSAYTPSGRIRSNFDTGTDWLVECSVGCSCGDDCPTRVVQRGRKIPIVIFRTVNRGWSVRTAENIPKNTFVMEYVGYVITAAEAKDARVEYMFDMNGCDEREHSYVIDASEYGGEARFVNHSCEPNIDAKTVYVERFGPDYHRIAYFTNRAIKKGEELTIDYYGNIDMKTFKQHLKSRDKKKCFCGSKKCRGYLL